MPTKSSRSVKLFFPRYSRDQVLEELQRILPVLRERLPITRLALFGSYATNRHTAASDIDLLVIYNGDTRADAYNVVRDTVGLIGLEPHVYSEAEAGEMDEVIDRMSRNAVSIETTMP